MVLNKRILIMVTALGVGLSLGWVLAAQQPQKAWKGKGGGQQEYALEQAAEKAPDAKQRIVALDEWKNTFPDTDFWDLREDLYLVSYAQLNDARKSFDMAEEILKRRPKHFLALNTIISNIYLLAPAGKVPAAADLTAAEHAAKYILDNSAAVFDPANKPGTIADPAQFAALKDPILKTAQKTYAWVFVQRKEWAKAEPEIRKVLKDDPSQANFTYFLAQDLLDQARSNSALLDTKYPEALYHFARAGSYSGPNAMQAAAKQQALNFFNNAYDTYHGSHEGADRVIQIASANVMPPAGFSIKDINTIKKEQFDAEQSYDAAHPSLTFWRDIVKGPLTGPNAQMVFETTYKDALLPGEAALAKGFSKFKGIIVTDTEEKGNTTGLTVAVVDPAKGDPTVANANLKFVETLPPGTMEPGQEIMFEGVVKSFNPDPFVVNFELDAKQIEGWTGTKGGKGK